MLEAGAHCPACQRRVRVGTQFCPSCGQTLSESPLRPLSAAAAPSGEGRAAKGAWAARRFTEHWEELKRIGWLFGLLLAMSLVFGLAWRASRSPWIDVGFALADALIVVVALGLRRRKLLFLFQLRPTTLRESLAQVAIAVVFVALATAYFRLIEHLGVPMASATAAFRDAGWPLWSMLVLVSVMPAVFEELAFRGVIQSALERVFNARDAWLIQAALFSVLHLSPLMFPSHFLMGLCFGYMRRRSRSIYPGMLLHAAWNALVVFQELPG